MLEKYPVRELHEIPEALRETPHIPKKLFIRGNLPSEDFILLAVVGSRKFTPYGKEVCEKLIKGLRGFPVAIVSGLALGIDSIAHKAALDAGLPTIAIPGSGLSQKTIYPHSHLSLAKEILDKGGCLLSELEENQNAAPWTFPARNRIMAGISKAVLVIEAEKKSGTMITARLATDYNRDVLTVPGSIFSTNSEGTNLLLKLGATPISSSEDIVEALGIEDQTKSTQKTYSDCSDEEVQIIELLSSPKSRDEICNEIEIEISELSQIITMLEIKEIVKESGGKIYLL